MRVLIYSDVHANGEALEAVEAAAGACDTSICLGDIVGYGASPNDTSAWVKAHTPLVIRGNHDRACASLDGVQGFNAVAAAAALWTHQQLSPEHLQWLQALPAGPLEWDGCSLVHGSPLDEDEYLLQPVQAAATFAATSSLMHWYGHSHIQGGFILADEQITPLAGAAAAAMPGAPAPRNPQSVLLNLRADARYLLNPGSVGQPRDGDWRAAFAIYDTAAATVEFRRVPYDVAQTQRRILDAGLPQRLAQRLALGR
ncbi:MAG: metallophosphoesterase family protein [Terriglobales bacterium]